MLVDTAPKALSRFLDLRFRDHEIHVSSQGCSTQWLGLRLRRRELRRRLLSRLRRLGEVRSADAEGSFIVDWRYGEPGMLPDVLQELDDIVGELAARPLTSRLVEEALAISSRERLRWTKDGRLPTSGSITIRRGQLITLSTYRVEAIAALVKAPATLRAWREADAQPPQDGGTIAS